MHNRKGFTLVELVVVVMILGILAAVAAPKLLNTSGTATDNGAKQSLAVIRDAIERYAAENGGNLPGADGDQDTFKSQLAEYLRGPFPKCPVGVANAEVLMDENETGPFAGPATAGDEAWAYRFNTGEFIINLGAETKMEGDGTTKYDEL